jgi:Pox virus entry-fusion-complex G9/A16
VTNLKKLLETSLKVKMVNCTTFIVCRITIVKLAIQLSQLNLENQDLDRKTLKQVLQEQLVDSTEFVRI